MNRTALPSCFFVFLREIDRDHTTLRRLSINRCYAISDCTILHPILIVDLKSIGIHLINDNTIAKNEVSRKIWISACLPTDGVIILIEKAKVIHMLHNGWITRVAR